jgi:hypothetical protein
MGEAKRKWVRLFDGLAQVAISRPRARLVSTQKYIAQSRPPLCFNVNCGNDLPANPVRLLVQTEKNTSPVTIGVCDHCARFSDDELRALLRDQFDTHFSLHPPAPGARITLPDGIEIAVAGMPIFITSMAGIDAAEAFFGLLEAGKLRRFAALYGGVADCHGITAALHHDLTDAGCAQLFAFKRGCSAVLKTARDPRGWHSDGPLMRPMAADGRSSSCRQAFITT